MKACIYDTDALIQIDAILQIYGSYALTGFDRDQCDG